MGVNIRRICIIGGTGMMGSWFGSLFEETGIEVLRTGRSSELEAADVVPLSDITVVSVPIREAVRVIREIGPLVPRRGLLMDLTSVKSEPMQEMLSHCEAEVLGAHPLFGPGDFGSSSLRVVLCPGRGGSSIKWMEGFLREKGLEVIVIDPETHDRLMGLIQGVNHFGTMCLGLCAVESGFSLDELLTMATPDFRKRIERIKAMSAQPVELFRSLLMENRHASLLLKDYCRKAELLLGAVERKEESEFDALWRSMSAFFSGKKREEE